MQIEISQNTWRWIGAVALALLLVLGWAWWDGGEEAMRPIEQAVVLPEATS